MQILREIFQEIFFALFYNGIILQRCLDIRTGACILTCAHARRHTYVTHACNIQIAKWIWKHLKRRVKNYKKSRRKGENKKQEYTGWNVELFLTVLWHGLRMGHVPDHLHPRPVLVCLYGHHPRYLRIVVRSPPKGSTYANRILPRYAYVTQSLFNLFV